jgi:hypothetical protein
VGDGVSVGVGVSVDEDEELGAVDEAAGDDGTELETTVEDVELE